MRYHIYDSEDESDYPVAQSQGLQVAEGRALKHAEKTGHKVQIVDTITLEVVGEIEFGSSESS